jgi:hypothetical protein
MRRGRSTILGISLLMLITGILVLGLPSPGSQPAEQPSSSQDQLRQPQAATATPEQTATPRAQADG